MTKVKINPASTVDYVGNTFITTSAEGFKALTDNGYRSVYMEMPKGLSGWTKPQGVDSETLRTYGTGSNFILLMEAVDQGDSKAQNFKAELWRVMTDLGNKMVMPGMAPGLTVETLVEGAVDHDKTLAQRAYLPHGYKNPEKTADDDLPLVGAPEEGGTKSAYIITRLAFTPVRGQDRRIYVVPTLDERYIGKRAYELGSTTLRQHIAGLYFDTYGEVLSTKEYGGIEDLLASDAHRNAETLKVENRSYRDADGSVWIDLGQDDCQTVKITPDGWTIQDMPVSTSRAFVPSESVRPINPPVPADGVPEAMGVLTKHLKPFVNIEDRDWPLVTGWMVNHLIAGSNSPILMLLGTNGSGKSTACNAINYAVEGGRAVPDSLEFSGKKDDVMVTLSKHKVAVFDNISKISADLSDNLAQVVYGKTYQKRKLRTDDDLVDLYIKSSVIMNGISTGQLREDLKDRMVVLNLAGTVSQQTNIYDLKASQVENHPQVYGALLSLVSAVMRVFRDENVPAPKSRARMDDYARVLWALDHLLGTQSVARYLETLDESAEDAQDDPLLWHSVALVRRQQTYDADTQVWSGMLGTRELMDAYNADSETWSARLSGGGTEALSARSIPERLTRVQAEWARLGVEVRMGEKRRTVINGRQQTAYPVYIHPKAEDIVREARVRDHAKFGYQEDSIN